MTGGDVARAGCDRSRGSQGTLQPVDADQLVIRDRPVRGIPDDGGQRDPVPDAERGERVSFEARRLRLPVLCDVVRRFCG